MRWVLGWLCCSGRVWWPLSLLGWQWFGWRRTLSTQGSKSWVFANFWAISVFELESWLSSDIQKVNWRLGWYQISWFRWGKYPDGTAALSDFGNHSHFQDNQDELGDEDNLEPDAAFLEYILRRIQQVKNDASFVKLSSPPRSIKRLVNDCNENYSSNFSKVNIGIVTSVQ